MVEIAKRVDNRHHCLSDMSRNDLIMADGDSAAKVELLGNYWAGVRRVPEPFKSARRTKVFSVQFDPKFNRP